MEGRDKMYIPQEVLHPVQAALEQWTDQRIIDDRRLESVLLFLLYGQSILSQISVKLSGFSCRQKQGNWLLTVKGYEGQTPLVVFITSATPTGCIEKFVDLYEDDKLSWNRDKFPWI